MQSIRSIYSSLGEPWTFWPDHFTLRLNNLFGWLIAYDVNIWHYLIYPFFIV